MSNSLEEVTLDPADWQRFRELGHKIFDDMVDGLTTLRDQPAWQEMPSSVRQGISGEALPLLPQGEEKAYADFRVNVEPYRLGNVHPGFYGWVMGPGVPFATLADMLAANMDPNCAGANQSSHLVEVQVVNWMKEALGYDANASGILASGGSMANLTALNVARHAKAGFDVRKDGLHGGPKLTVYGSSETHNWILKGVELLGLGSSSFRSVPVDSDFRVNVSALKTKINEDRAAGVRPFCVIANVGTVNTGAVDDINALADLCENEGLWLHADGAFGALVAISPTLRPIVAGLDRVDSVGFDLHKWMYLPFEIACVLVKDGAAHKAAFATQASYLAPHERGVIAGGIPFAESGYELSRGFKALKAWMCIKAYGMERFARAIEMNVDEARHLTDIVNAADDLELMAPTALNIVCFRYNPGGVSDEALSAINEETLLRIQERGIAVPSSTTIDGKYVLRIAIVNHRTKYVDLSNLAKAVLEIAAEVAAEMAAVSR